MGRMYAGGVDYEWARVHNPSCRDVLRVLAQLAGTLEVLHRGECLHRDVKGDNILVEPEGRAVLVDFGSGTWMGAPPLTEWVVPPNTREYRSPESLRLEWSPSRKHGVLYETRPADDLYALGVAAYRLMAGVYPPPGTDPEALKAQFQVPLPARRPVHELNKRVVPELSALIERMHSPCPGSGVPPAPIAEKQSSMAHVGSAWPTSRRHAATAIMSWKARATTPSWSGRAYPPPSNRNRARLRAGKDSRGARLLIVARINRASTRGYENG
jgi:eukaryotic-like serine/threonine-protein kinase